MASKSEFLATPKPAPDLHVPSSTTAVKVSAIDSGARFSLPIKALLLPELAGKPNLHGPAFSYLIEHPSGRKILFDLSIPSDLEYYPPKIRERLKNPDWDVTPGKDIIRILEEGGIKGNEIEAVIWSHWHWDHTGDPSLFPPSTSLIVGPGFKSAHLPGYPSNPDGRVNSSAWANRTLHEISFSSSSLQIGRFQAHDYFHDGSFYLLNTPGHAIGHLCALARTRSSGHSWHADTFVYLGGDVCHHGGEFRPTAYLPLPTQLTPHQVPRLRTPCPGSLFEDFHPRKSKTEPFYRMSEGFPDDVERAQWSVEGTEEFDAWGNVLVGLAHDETLIGILPFWPRGGDLGRWKQEGLKERALWAFLGDWDVKGVERRE